MIEFRDQYPASIGARLIVHTNEEAITDGTQPFLVGTQRCCGLLKTKSLLDALEAGGFDGGVCGAGATRRSPARGATRSGRARKSGSSRSATGRVNGTPRINGPSCGTC